MSSCTSSPISNSKLTYSTKKANSHNRPGPRPPKLNLKKRPRCSLFGPRPLKAKEISFTNNNVCNLSHLYDDSDSLPYFEQCYENISKIGEGSFGEVFKVRSKEDGKLYAVKKTRRARLDEVRRFEQIPPHNNCVRFHHAWEQGDLIYMQMELCGTSLENYTQTVHEIPEEKVWEMLLDLALAVKNIHNHNIIHLDIKPANIMLGTNNQCKLGDFGLAFDLTNGNIKDAVEGDSKYIAPELMQGDFGKAADIFSLGITILELASDLDLPQCGPLWQKLRVGELPYEITQALSNDLIVVIRKMMAPNPLDRPTADELVRHPRLCMIAAKRLGTFFFHRMTSNMINAYAWVINKFWTSTTFMFLSMNYICKAMRMLPNGVRTNQQSSFKRESVSDSADDNSDMTDNSSSKPLSFDAKRPRINIVNSTPVRFNSSTPVHNRSREYAQFCETNITPCQSFESSSLENYSSHLATNLFLQTLHDSDEDQLTPARTRDSSSQPVMLLSAKKLSRLFDHEDSD